MKSSDLDEKNLKPESTFGDLPVGARFIVPWTGDVFVKTAAKQLRHARRGSTSC